ncbi:MAG TPA: hypothetical protein VK753_09025, partial [Xanthomonadaceae bacterium]|nr:hypothetical protein [Xanthomonadaceae bacterium]
PGSTTTRATDERSDLAAGEGTGPDYSTRAGSGGSSCNVRIHRRVGEACNRRPALSDCSDDCSGGFHRE